MRILYVTDALAIYGGLERILVEKINLLVGMYGYEMYVVTANQGNHPMPFALNEGVCYRDLNILFHKQYQYKGLRRLLKRVILNRLFKKMLREHIQAVRPDVIVLARADLMGTVLKSKGNIPLVFESHVSRYAQRFGGANLKNLILSSFYNRKVRKADVVVALTKGDANDWKSLNSQVRVIPNVVHLSVGGLYSTCHNKKAIFVGRFSHQKDIGSLIDIWEIVHGRHPDWQIHIYGGYGEERESLQAEIKRRNINMIVHESTPDIFQKYQESSMLLLTSRYEPFGLVLPEAMSFGLPVVAFDCPYGPSEIVTDGYDGFLVSGRNIVDFANRVCLLIENPELRQSLGKAGIQSSMRYSAEQVMPLWKKLFEELTTKEKVE